jgi:DNA-binding CsgD family transcriptional regulator
MDSEKSLINLIQLVYEAAADPGQWPVVLKAYAESVGSPAVTFIAHNFANQYAAISASVGFEPALGTALRGYCASRNVWIEHGAHFLRPGVVAGSSEMFPNREIVKTEFYDAFLLPQDHFCTFGGTVLQGEAAVSCLTAVRSKAARPFEKREFALLRHLLPHLQTAVHVRQRVAVLETELGNMRQTLDHLRQGLFMVDGMSRVLVMNREAERILTAADGLIATKDGLRTTRAQETKHLRCLIEGAVKTTSGNGIHHGGAMSVSRNGRTPLRVLVSPSAPSGGPARGRSSAILFVTEMEQPRIPDSTLLRQLFGFTPAEARLATALVAGKTLQEFAEEASVSLNTVRTHLKRLFSKAGVTRQAELVRLLTTTTLHHKT